MYWYCKEKVRVNNLVPRAREQGKKPWESVEDNVFNLCFSFQSLTIFDLVWSRDFIISWCDQEIIISWFGIFLLWWCLTNLKTMIWRISLRPRLRYKIKTSNGIKLWKTVTCICTLFPPYCVSVLFLQQFFKLQKQVFHAVWWHVLQVRLRFEFKFYSACLYMWFFSFYFVAGTLVQLI